jgi:putative oxidoreductase
MTTNSSIESESLPKVSRHAHWLLRFALASVFLYMGIDKFMGGGIGEFAEIMALPYPMAVLVALAEIGAGVFIIAGAVLGTLITRLGALAALPVLLGAIFMVHWGQWHFMVTPTHPLGGMMFQVTLVMLALYMLIRGNEA